MQETRKITDECVIGPGKYTRHRHIYAEHYGWESIEGLLVRHKCDNPWCVNIDHLEPGDARDNARDKIDRGRYRNGTRSPVGYCKSGHPLQGSNLCGSACATCANWGQRRKRWAREGTPDARRSLAYPTPKGTR